VFLPFHFAKGQLTVQASSLSPPKDLKNELFL